MDAPVLSVISVVGDNITIVESAVLEIETSNLLSVRSVYRLLNGGADDGLLFYN
jgi:hypothetical protein